MPPTHDTSTTPPRKEGGRWGRIPAWWLDHPDLDADGLAVLAALATYADENGVCWPSQSTLATKLKRSRPTVNRILQRLEGLGLVRIAPRRGADGARLSSLYRLRFEPDGHGVDPMDRADSVADAGCPPASQKQVHSEQIPDSLPHAAREGAREVPDGWMPSAADLAWAGQRYGAIDLTGHVEGFVLRCRAHGYRYRDAGAAWRAWLTQDVAAGKALLDTTVPAATKTNPAEVRVNAWIAAAARLQSHSAPFGRGNTA